MIVSHKRTDNPEQAAERVLIIGTSDFQINETEDGFETVYFGIEPDELTIPGFPVSGGNNYEAYLTIEIIFEEIDRQRADILIYKGHTPHSVDIYNDALTDEDIQKRSSNSMYFNEHDDRDPLKLLGLK